MTASTTIARFDRAFLARLADWFAVAVAVALPWSTTAVGVCILAWLVTLLPTLDAAAVRRELTTAAGGVPVLLWCVGALGVFWADVGWHERFAGLDSFHRLLTIPLLLAQFRRSDRGIWVVCGFFISSITVLIASYVIVLTVKRTGEAVYGVPVHDTIFQGSVFLISGFGALGYAALAPAKAFWPWPATICLFGALFLVNFEFVTISRIGLVVAPILLLLLGWRLLRWKGIFGTCVLMVLIGAATWFASPVVRDRVDASIKELQEYRATNEATSIGEHLAFLQESWTIIAAAPLIGHGTGSITEQFRRVTAGKTGVSAQETVNPHNQTFGIAIQLGLVGAIILWAMWIAHLMLFWAKSAIGWIGLVIVVENMVSSTAHSHLFDFNNGWLYVFGVGVLGGSVLREGAKTLAEPVLFWLIGND